MAEKNLGKGVSFKIHVLEMLLRLAPVPFLEAGIEKLDEIAEQFGKKPLRPIFAVQALGSGNECSNCHLL